MRDGGAPVRVHLVVHHHLSQAGGVTGATLALGQALGDLGCDVSYYSFDDAFGAPGGREVPRMISFPWKVASHLARSARGYDIVDASTGDAWLWAWRGRPGNPRATLVVRAHGLEHTTSNDVRARARRGQMALSWKYSIYHGGYRLREVQQSLVRADAQVFLNEIDRDLAVTTLGVPTATSAVIPNALPVRMLGLEPPPDRAAGPIALTFIGNWVALKGTAALAEMASTLHGRVPFTLRLLGTGADAATVLGAFAPDVRASISVLPRYAPADLPALLRDAEVLVHPSWTEGFSLGLVEGMASGLAPIATRSGGATTVIEDGVTGLLMADESGRTLADCVMRLAADRPALLTMRRAAQASVQSLSWSAIATRTLRVYRDAMGRR